MGSRPRPPCLRHDMTVQHKGLVTGLGIDSAEAEKGCRMARIIDGDELAEVLRAEIEEEVSVLRLSAVRPDSRP